MRFIFEPWKMNKWKIFKWLEVLIISFHFHCHLSTSYFLPFIHKMVHGLIHYCHLRNWKTKSFNTFIISGIIIIDFRMNGTNWPNKYNTNGSRERTYWITNEDFYGTGQRKIESKIEKEKRISSKCETSKIATVQCTLNTEHHVWYLVFFFFCFIFIFWYKAIELSPLVIRTM